MKQSDSVLSSVLIALEIWVIMDAKVDMLTLVFSISKTQKQCVSCQNTYLKVPKAHVEVKYARITTSKTTQLFQ